MSKKGNLAADAQFVKKSFVLGRRHHREIDMSISEKDFLSL
jgi:hypothetical protein